MGAAITAVRPSFDVFFDTRGKPLDSGFIYIGVDGLNPVSNPIDVFADPLLSIPLPQPIRTSGGYPVRDGSPTMIYTAVSYSLLVLDKQERLVYSSLTNEQALSVGQTFQLGETGSVFRSVSDKLGDVKSIKDFGVIGNGTTDDTVKIRAAIAGVGPNDLLIWPAGTYLVTDEILFENDRINMIGAGVHATKILFMPTANASCFKFKKSPGSPINQCSVREMSFWSDDDTYVKTALDVYDTSLCLFENIAIGGSIVFGGGGYWRNSATASSIGIRTHGRDTTTFRNILCYADKSIVISPLDSAGIELSADHFVFENMYLSSAQNPIITVEPGCVLTQVSFIGYQAWVGGTYGFLWVDATTPGASNGLYLNNVRREGSTDPTKWFVDIDLVSGLQSLVIRGGQTGVTNGIYLRNAQNVLFDSFYYTDATRVALNVNATVYPITVQNCFWQTGSTASITGLIAVLKMPNAISMPVATDGVYTLDSTVSYNFEVNGTLGETAVSVPNTVRVPIGSSTQRGFIFITTSSDVSAIFCLMGPTANAIEVSDPSGFFSTVAGTAGYNVFWNSGNNRYELENFTGSTKTVKWFRVGTGQGF